jgi:hypothetical protein
MRGVNTRNIKTKDDLKSMLFFFHNSVNQRTQKQRRAKVILDQYENKQFPQVVNLFIQAYGARYGSIVPGNISNLGKRKAIGHNTVKWIRQHCQYFG